MTTTNLFADALTADELREALAAVAFDDTACDAADAAHDTFIEAHDRAIDTLNNNTALSSTG